MRVQVRRMVEVHESAGVMPKQPPNLFAGHKILIDYSTNMDTLLPGFSLVLDCVNRLMSIAERNLFVHGHNNL